MDDLRERVMRLALEQRNPIWAYCLALCRDPTAAEDLFQDTHLTICRKWQDWREPAPFLAWALTIVRFTYLSGLDDRHRRLVLLDTQTLAEVVMEAEAESGHLATARLSALRACLAKLGQRPRQIIERRYLDGSSCEEVARQLGMGLPAVYQMLSRLRRSLADCIASRLAKA